MDATHDTRTSRELRESVADRLVNYIDTAPASRLTAFADALETQGLADDPAIRWVATLVRQYAARRSEQTARHSTRVAGRSAVRALIRRARPPRGGK